MAMVIAVLLIVALLKTAISTQEKFITVPESQVAAHLITHLRGDVHHATEVVLVRSHEVTVTHPVFRAFVDTLSATIESLAPEIVQPESLLTYYRVGARALIAAAKCTSITGVKRANTTAAVGVAVGPLFPGTCWS